MYFADQPDYRRMEIRAIIDAHQGDVAGYDREGVQVTLPADPFRRQALIMAIGTIGGRVREGSRYWFPACNGEPEYQLRWKRTEDRGNRCAAYVEFAVFDF